MEIRFERISNTHHIVRIVRADGSEDQVECETKSAWNHDLVHYAVESEASLPGGFWGLLAKGYSFSALNDRTGESIKNDASEIMTIEGIVGAMQGFIASKRETGDFVDYFRSQGDGLGYQLPQWFTEDFVDRVGEKVRQLVGNWNSVPFGREMVLKWPSL